MRATSKPHLLVLGALAALFGLRVAGQAIQRFHPQSWLPASESFQGSNLSYPTLLCAQVAILGLMVRACWRSARGAAQPNHRAGRILAAIGGVYIAGSISRIIIGLAVPSAPAWFSTWIPAFFHVVIAGFVLAAADLHLRAARAGDGLTTRLLPWLWYPLSITFAVALFVGLLERGVSTLVAMYVPIASVGAAIVALEFVFPARREWRPRRADVTSDALFMVLIQTLLPRTLVAGLALIVAATMHARAPSPWWPHQWPLLAQAMTMLLAVDFLRYWLHRACHTFLPLWRLHEVHHSPDILYTLNVARFHPLEKILHFALDTVPFVLLGVAPEVVAAYFLLYAVNGFFQHSNLQLRYGWLNYVVGSAETHRWHHARNPCEAYCNFGNTTIVWDLLFRTWSLPSAREVEIGIPDRRYPKDFRAQMLAPFRSTGGTRRGLAEIAIAMQALWTRMTSSRRLTRALRDPLAQQAQVLAAILERNRHTEFGRKHGFASIDGPAEFAARVPVSDYESLRPFVEQQLAEQTTALTAEAPSHYLRTSGTTGTPKDIPLVPSHLRKLRAINQLSIARQHRRSAAAFRGGILVITSPAEEGRFANGKPYGAASGIVSGSAPRLVRSKFVLPQAVLAIADSHVKYLLILQLAIARRDITYLGTANASTLLHLIRLYREHAAALIAGVRDGCFFLAARLSAETLQAIEGCLHADPMRAAELDRFSRRDEPTSIRDLWSNLQLVVTWTCGSAGVAARALRAELPPQARIHELGYVSSEFRGTITLGRRPGSGLPTFDTHYFEFVERDLWDRDETTFLTLDQLRKGVDYYVIVTTPSGLYRYFINDLVRVTGHLHRMPLLKFLQKGKGVTNITGEKLYEAQVLDAVGRVVRQMGRAAQFVMMLADEENRSYRLYLQSDVGPRASHDVLAAEVDARLRRLNIEYDAKRESGRLAPLVAHWLRTGTDEAYKQANVRHGQREAQFKIVALRYCRESRFDFDNWTE